MTGSEGQAGFISLLLLVNLFRLVIFTLSTALDDTSDLEQITQDH